MTLQTVSKSRSGLPRSILLVVAVTSTAFMYGLFVVTEPNFKHPYFLNQAPAGPSKNGNTLPKPMAQDAIYKASGREDLEMKDTTPPMAQDAIYKASGREDLVLEMKNTTLKDTFITKTLTTVIVNEIVRRVSLLANIKAADLINMTQQTLRSFSVSYMASLLAILQDMDKTKHCSNCTRWPPSSRIIVDSQIRIHYNKTWNGFQLPLIVAFENGRLGNIMGEYATAFALKTDVNNSLVTVTASMKEKLQAIFPQISMQGIKVNDVSSWTNINPIPGYLQPQLAAVGLLGPRIFRVRGYPCEFQLFHVHRDKIRREFTFSDNLLGKATSFLTAVKEAAPHPPSNEPLMFIGVHIRLGDYKRYMLSKHGLESLNYTNYLMRAVQYYKSLYRNVAFVVASDEIKYALKFFKGIGERNAFFPAVKGFFQHVNESVGVDSIPLSKREPEEDMSLLAQCNHSIITLGTYGFWTGYLSQGTTLYPDIRAPKVHLTSRIVYEAAKLDNFIPLSTL